MKRKISFHNMEHSDPMEAHANSKLNKIEELLQGPEWETPKHLELWLKANKMHPHHETELHLKTPQFELNAHATGTDMYVVIDETVDKMVTLIKKEKTKLKDKHQKVKTAKNNFGNDKYNL